MIQLKTDDPTHRATTSTERGAVARIREREKGLHDTDDCALVFTLPDALREIRNLREQKAEMIEALKYVAGHIGGSIGERAARALGRINGTIRWNR